MAKRFRIVAVLEGDLDGFSGMMHQETDWQLFAFREFLAQAHYNTKVTITESTDHRQIMGGYRSIFEGWIECSGDEIPDDMHPSTMVQVRTVRLLNGYLNGWYPAADVWSEERRSVNTKLDDHKVTHYRPRLINPHS